ncbi:hypothetical protein HF576_06115 [Microbacterium sp. CFH 90308]|uniref:Secreted protein n=1 Tax=Microbacterium salsuginis TaxID=2722803 RepID=A0ABX1K8S6_9MICO|nr:hypothetical protein [Microbacterium sp. CFH 90308]NLP83411.1 hypothetical protein [Microbacterium sp. CFH 90308]
MTGWWRSNAIALGALAVLIPAAALTMSWNEWAGIRQGSATEPISVAPGESVRYADAHVGPVSAEFTELPLAPQDARVLAVTVQIDPGDPPIACSAFVLREVDGAMREWTPRDDLGREWDSDRWTFCDDEATAPYEVELDYLVPEDASGPFTVEFGSAGSYPEFVSAVVAP